jgi:hypothetical protein
LAIILEPSGVATAIAIAAYIGSLVVALSGIQSKRVEAAIKRGID